MTAVIPASTASRGPSENGKKASKRARRRSESAPVARTFSIREPNRVDAAHLARADPHRRQAVGQHDRVRGVLAHLPGEQHLAPLALGRLALGHHLHLRAVLEVEIAVLHQQAADDRLRSHSEMLTRRRSPSSRIRRFGFEDRTSTASPLMPGAITTSTNCPVSACASSASIGRSRPRRRTRTPGRTRTRAGTPRGRSCRPRPRTGCCA